MFIAWCSNFVNEQLPPCSILYIKKLDIQYAIDIPNCNTIQRVQLSFAFDRLCCLQSPQKIVKIWAINAETFPTVLLALVR